MMKIVSVLVVVLAVVSSQPITQSNDDLESIANTYLLNIGNELNANQTLKAFLTKTDVKESRVNELNTSDKRLLISEGIGGLGATVIAVKRGQRSVTITNVWGLAAGAAIDIEGHKNDIKTVDKTQEANKIRDELKDKYMKSIVEKDSKAGILVLLEGGKAGEALIATKKGNLVAKGAAGFALGSYTEITKN